MKDIVAIYPGTFDPLTRGHEDLIVRASQLWPRVVVAIAVAHHKKTLFSCEERLNMAKMVLAPYKNVSVFSFAGLLQQAVMEHKASVIVRGLRGSGDFDYEFQLAGLNQHLIPEVETTFLIANPKYYSVSGTLVREVALLGGDISDFVAPYVEKKLKEKELELNIKEAPK